MLTDRAAQLTARVNGLKQKRSQAEKAGSFRTRAQALSEPAQLLERWSAMVTTEFRARGISVPIDVAKAAGLRSQVQQFASTYLTDPESILKGDGELRFKFWENLKGFPQQVEGVIRTAWAGYVRGRLPVGEPELLNVLEQVPGFSAHVQVISRGRDQQMRLASALPTAESYAQVETLAATLTAAWDKLRSANLSPETKTFLSAVTRGQATLAHVTPTVRSWLEQHGLLQAFKVKL